MYRLNSVKCPGSVAGCQLEPKGRFLSTFKGHLVLFGSTLIESASNKEPNDLHCDLQKLKNRCCTL